MRFSFVALLVAVSAAAAVVVDATESGVRGEDRHLVQGENQTPCGGVSTSDGCQWGVYQSVTVQKLWVTHENIFWRCQNPGMMALTFDDGPSDTMASVLYELNVLNVTATFFINGANIEADSGTAQVLTRAEEEGHVIAHHTYDHEKSSQRVEYQENGEPTEAMLEWFEKQFDANFARAQEYLPLKGLRPYFRPPFLDIDEETATYLEEKYGIYVVQVNTDSREEEKSSQDIFRYATGNVYAGPGDVDVNSWIFLQHDKIEETAGAVSKIVEFGWNLGYEFVGIDECLGFPSERELGFTSAPTPMPCEGEPCESTYDCRSEFGYCGSGPGFCDKNPQWVPKCLTGELTGDRDALLHCSAVPCDSSKMCRSKSGWCGTGDDYCNDNSVWLPECDGDATTAGIAVLALTILSGVSAMLV